MKRFAVPDRANPKLKKLELRWIHAEVLGVVYNLVGNDALQGVRIRQNNTLNLNHRTSRQAGLPFHRPSAKPSRACVVLNDNVRLLDNVDAENF